LDASGVTVARRRRHERLFTPHRATCTNCAHFLVHSLLAHEALAASLKGVRAPLEAAKFSVTPDGTLTVELELMVGGAVVGLRLHGRHRYVYIDTRERERRHI